jgi:hypothetical protein
MLSGSEILASQMASGSAAIQCLSGIAAIVLGILAVTGILSETLTLVGLLVLGATVLLTGTTLSGSAMSFMEPVSSERLSIWSQSSGAEEPIAVAEAAPRRCFGACKPSSAGAR